MAEDSKAVPEYLSYLLRLWRQAGDDGTPTWRAALEAPVTHELHFFAHLDGLFTFLGMQVGQVHSDEGMNNESRTEQ